MNERGFLDLDALSNREIGNAIHVRLAYLAQRSGFFDAWSFLSIYRSRNNILWAQYYTDDDSSFSSFVLTKLDDSNNIEKVFGVTIFEDHLVAGLDPRKIDNYIDYPPRKSAVEIAEEVFLSTERNIEIKKAFREGRIEDVLPPHILENPAALNFFRALSDPSLRREDENDLPLEDYPLHLEGGRNRCFEILSILDGINPETDLVPAPEY